MGLSSSDSESETTFFLVDFLIGFSSLDSESDTTFFLVDFLSDLIDSHFLR